MSYPTTHTYDENDFQLAAQEGMWRAEMLSKTDAIAVSAASAASGSAPPNPAAPAAGTANALHQRITNTTGNIAAGAMYVRIENVGAADGQVNAVVLKSGEIAVFPTDYGILLPLIAIVATGTDFIISKVYPPAIP